MTPATLTFLRQRFLEYYGGERVLMPPSLEEREWGFFIPGEHGEGHMRRHMAFRDAAELMSYIRGLVPFHVYYSVAYYRNPGGPTMADKGWLGADLIFDLDADHIVRGEYSMMLARVKEETEKLVFMLCEELGIPRGAIDVVFSGGRGYHIHVREIAFRSFDSAERRELIDYVCGTGLDAGIMVAQGAEKIGWSVRFQSSLNEYLLQLHSLPVADAVRELTSFEGVGKATAERFLKLTKPLPAEEGGKFRSFEGNREVIAVLHALMGDPQSGLVRAVRSRAALADEPVTTDTKRLIRMPTSLHGGSGLRVTPLSLTDLPAFDPLVDAVVFGDRQVKVELKKSCNVSLLGDAYSLSAGICAVPLAVAVFLCCRGMAEIAG